jgi:hypothetical protein
MSKIEPVIVSPTGLDQPAIGHPNGDDTGDNAGHAAGQAAGHVQEREKRQRQRSIAIALCLIGLVLLFYAATIIRLGGNALNRAM